MANRLYMLAARLAALILGAICVRESKEQFCLDGILSTVDTSGPTALPSSSHLEVEHGQVTEVLQTDVSHIQSIIELSDLPCNAESDKVCQYVKQNNAFPAAAAEEKKEPDTFSDEPPWISLTLTSNISGRSYVVFNKQLAAGVFGQVFRAAELNDRGEENKYLAAKVFTSFENIPIAFRKERGFLDKKQFETGISKEFLMQNAVHNDHVVRAEDALLSYSSAEDGTLWYRRIMMMEVIEWENLKFALQQTVALQQTGFSEVEIKRYAVQLVEGLVRIHALDFVHLDLKLANCIRDNTGKLKWTNFGFAEVCNGDTGCTLGGPRSAYSSWGLGTLDYMAPELLSQGQVTFGKKSDVWSLGAIFFEMLYGHAPFSSSSWSEIAARINGAKYSIGETGGKRFRDLIQRMLVVDPAKRESLQTVQQEVKDWSKS